MKSSIIFIIIASIAVAVGITAAVVLVSYQPHSQISPVTENKFENNVTSQAPIQNLKKFNSADELQKFLLDSQIKTSSQYSSPVLENQLRLARSNIQLAAPVPAAPQGTQAPATTSASTGSSGAQYSTTHTGM